MSDTARPEARAYNIVDRILSTGSINSNVEATTLLTFAWIELEPFGQLGLGVERVCHSSEQPLAELDQTFGLIDRAIQESTELAVQLRLDRARELVKQVLVLLTSGRSA